MKALSYLFYSTTRGSGLRATAEVVNPAASVTVSISSSRRFLVVFFCLGLLACGNKGPLYLPIDEAALQELESVQEELDEAEESNAKKNSATTTPVE